MYRFDGGHYGSGLSALGNLSTWKDQLVTIAPTAVAGVAGVAAAHYLTGKVFDAVKGDGTNTTRVKAAPYVALATPFIGAIATRAFIPADPGTRRKQMRDGAAAGMAIYGTAAVIAYFLGSSTNETAKKIAQAMPFTTQSLAGFGNLPNRWPAGTPNLGVNRYPYPRPGQMASIPPTQTRVLPAGMAAIPPQTTSVRRIALGGTSGSMAGMSY